MPPIDEGVDFVPLKVAVLTVSDTRDEAQDRSGKLLVDRLESAGHNLYEKKIERDDIYKIRAIVAHWCAEDDPHVVITTGGTGLTGRDGTPEAVRPLLDKEIEGFGEVFRVISYEEIGGSTIQSRAIAGVCNGTYVFCLPGSTGACATAWDRLIGGQLDKRNQPCNLVELMPRLLEQ